MIAIHRIILPFVIIFLMNNGTHADSECLPDINNRLISINDNINVRDNPSLNSNILYQLRIANKVELIKRSNIKQEINGIKGEWIFIDTGRYKVGQDKSIKGWVFDKFFSSYSNFIRLKTINKCNIVGMIGDYDLSLKVNSDGTYEREKFDQNTRKLIKQNGKLYHNTNVVIAKDNDANVYDFFFINDQGFICHNFRDKNNIPIFCSKCKMK